MAERKSGPVKPPVIDLKAKPAPRAARSTPERPVASEAADEPATVPEAEAAAATEAAPEARQPPPPPPRPQARLAMPWSAISIAAIVGALLGTALTYGLVNWLPLPDGRTIIADPAPRLDTVDAGLSELDGRVTAVEEQGKRTQVSLDATIAQLDAGLAEVRQTIAALQIPQPVDLGPLETRLSGLEDRVTAIGAGASSADATALAQTISVIETSLSELRTQLGELQQRVATTETGVAGLRGDMSAAQGAISSQTQVATGGDVGQAVRLPLVISGIESAVANGRPYATELSGLRAILPDFTVPEGVSSAADTGLPRPDAVTQRFSAAVPAILAARAGAATGDWGQDALEWLKGLMAVRPAGEIDGDTPEAVVSRLEAAIGRRDFGGAATLLDELPPAMQVAAGQVGAEIKVLAAADAFITELRARALASTTGGGQ